MFSILSRFFNFQNLADILYQCQTIWISADTQPFVGPHLDPNCLQRSSRVLQIQRVNITQYFPYIIASKPTFSASALIVNGKICYNVPK